MRTCSICGDLTSAQSRAQRLLCRVCYDRAAQLVESEEQNMQTLPRAETVNVPTIFIEYIACADAYAVRTPYSPAASGFKTIPGRCWCSTQEINVFPAAAKHQIWRVLQEAYAGHCGVGPAGPFQVPTSEIPW